MSDIFFSSAYSHHKHQVGNKSIKIEEEKKQFNNEIIAILYSFIR